MTRRIWVKLGLAAFLLAVAALPARATPVPVTEFDGDNLAYSATVQTVLGVEFLQVTFAPANPQLTAPYNQSNIVSNINNTFVGSLFSLWTSVGAGTNPGNTDPSPYTNPYVTGISGGNVGTDGFSPGSTGGDIGVQDDSGVVLNFLINFSTTSGVPGAEGLNLNGNVYVDNVNFPTNPTTLTVGSTTYDFSPFLFGNTSYMTNITITLNSVSDLIGDIAAGMGTFQGTASFSASATAVPEPTSGLLLCMGGMIAGFASRQRRKA
jgi:hypothetical protein